MSDTQTVLFIGGPADGKRWQCQGTPPDTYRVNSTTHEPRSPLNPVDATFTYSYVEYALQRLSDVVRGRRVDYFVYTLRGNDAPIQRLIAGYAGGK